MDLSMSNSLPTQATVESYSITLLSMSDLSACAECLRTMIASQNDIIHEHDQPDELAIRSAARKRIAELQAAEELIFAEITRRITTRPSGCYFSFTP
jgi:hypothetical protein